tara:strand:- start:4999 stop:6252 length:1254 start_codon:yes stop_codon:yes gene_type:complete
MLDLHFNRRDFLRIGGMGTVLGGAPLFDEAFGQDEPRLVPNDRSVVWVWLGGGPTQFETFHAPTNAVPDPYKPVSGLVTHSNGLAFGGLFKDLIQQGDRLTAVNSFSHGDSSHRQATHWMMTGHKNPKRENTADSEYPGHGAVISSVFGSNHPVNGMPAYVKQGKIEGEQPAFLGGAHKPFDPSNKDNLTPRIETVRFSDRKGLLDALDRGNRVPSEEAQSFSRIGNTAYNVILGNAKEAFDIDKEPEAMREKYGKGGIGDQMLLARRLAQFGTKFVTVHYGGWDMHGNIKKSLEGKVPPLDKALAAFVDDIYESGISEKVLLVVTGEFGRTRLNQNGGRDHWPSITPMLLSGGSYDHGRVIGRSDKAYYPTESKVGPIDVAATLFDHFQIDTNIQKVDQSGRPRYLLEGDGRVFLS